MWRFYLLSCAGAFRARSLQVYGILFAKPESKAQNQALSAEPNEAMAAR